MGSGDERMSARSFGELPALPDEDRSHELLDGELVERAPCSVEQGAAEFGLLAFLGQFRRAGERGEEDGWLFAVGPELALGPRDVFRPLLAGWVRRRLAEVPPEKPLRVVPDFVVELDSAPRTAEQDRRLAIYHRSAVRYIWLVDAEARRLLVLERGDDEYCELVTAWGRERVFAEPFDAIEVGVSDLLGDDYDEPE